MVHTCNTSEFKVINSPTYYGYWPNQLSSRRVRKHKEHGETLGLVLSLGQV